MKKMILAVGLCLFASSSVFATGLHHEMQCMIKKSNKAPTNFTWPLIMSHLASDKSDHSKFNDGQFTITASVDGTDGVLTITENEFDRVVARTTIPNSSKDRGNISILDLPLANILVSCAYLPN